MRSAIDNLVLAISSSRMVLTEVGGGYYMGQPPKLSLLLSQENLLWVGRQVAGHPWANDSSDGN